MLPACGTVSTLDNEGLPQGEFYGRPNLFAFLQAKHWDSNAAVYPESHESNDGHAAARNGFQAFWRPYQRTIMSNSFDLVVGAIIMANSISMAFQLEYEGQETADVLDLPRDDGVWQYDEQVFIALDQVFTVAFLVELVLRLSVMRCTYFRNFLNWMDFIIVAISVLELFVLPLFGESLPKMTFVRLLRIFKLVRVFRILRVLRLFGRLRSLLAAVVASMHSFGWSICLLGIVQLVASIFMTLSLQSFLRDESADEEKRKQVYVFFGTLSRACITLFEMTLAVGTWGRVGRVVIFDINRNYALFFLGYMVLVSFALIRVIAAIFLKETLAAAAKDGDLLMAENNRHPDFVKRIWMLFQNMTSSKKASMSLTELHESLMDTQNQLDLKGLGLHPHEVEGLFALMDDGDDEITFAEFLTGSMRLKNAHKGVDLATLLYENKKLLSRMLTIESSIEKLRDDLEGRQILDETGFKLT
eukprot:gnl/MRDRNA2_/MRDRNA2_208398_c0_seq1.p1 gnl/MRDRNA2_/MRDRNA2_208398_c0~~gnl/MRDRNA2_/MRDRNA2_208398_c0_seq1.p1  ORF type:complete len:513 (+),score=89.28 gnl/MRDRNA2_/MRDRNA2_208398_c0_seq1:123-1541(+)